MSKTHLKYHLPITRKGIYDNSVKLLLALSIFAKVIGRRQKLWLARKELKDDFLDFQERKRLDISLTFKQMQN